MHFAEWAMKQMRPPPTLLQIDGTDARSVQKTPAGTPKNEHLCSFLGYKFAGANLLLLGTSGILAASAFPALLQIGGADTRREQKLTAGVLFAR